jgi:hypothetical protein
MSSPSFASLRMVFIIGVSFSPDEGSRFQKDSIASNKGGRGRRGRWPGFERNERSCKGENSKGIPGSA